MGAMRASAQVISYELAMGLSVLPVVMWVAKSAESPLSLFEIAKAQENLWFCIVQPLSAFLFLVALFAETNRLPFDMAESETDLVSGYHTEYGSFKFGLFFVGEYGHMVLGSSLFIVLFHESRRAPVIDGKHRRLVGILKRYARLEYIFKSYKQTGNYLGHIKLFPEAQTFSFNYNCHGFFR